MSAEAVTTKGDLQEVAMAIEQDALEVVPTEVLTEVPKSPRTP